MTWFHNDTALPRSPGGSMPERRREAARFPHVAHPRNGAGGRLPDRCAAWATAIRHNPQRQPLPGGQQARVAILTKPCNLWKTGLTTRSPTMHIPYTGRTQLARVARCILPLRAPRRAAGIPEGLEFRNGHPKCPHPISTAMREAAKPPHGAVGVPPCCVPEAAWFRAVSIGKAGRGGHQLLVWRGRMRSNSCSLTSMPHCRPGVSWVKTKPCFS